MGNRYYPNSKRTVEECYCISIQSLKKWGFLSGYHSTTLSWTSTHRKKETMVMMFVDVRDEPYIRLYYSTIDREGNETVYDYEVSLTTTPCYFGGARYWFLCPLCFRRVRALYLAPGHTQFRCRHCNNLSYNSRNTSCIGAFGVACRKAEKLRVELKRWTYRGLPTKKVRRLRRLEQKTRIFGSLSMQRINKLEARIARR